MILWWVRFFPFPPFISDFWVLSPISRFCRLKMSPTLRNTAIWLVLLKLHMTFVLDSFILIISHFNKQIHVIYEIKREMASWLYFSLVLKVISGSPSLEIQFERTGVKILWLNSFNFAWFRNTLWSLLRFLPETQSFSISQSRVYPGSKIWNDDKHEDLDIRNL